MEKYQLSARELQSLRVEHRRQLKRSGRSADRVKAVYLLGSGWSVQRVCEALLIDDNTVRDYFQAYDRGGIEALLKTHFKGSEKKLTDEELQLLDEHLQETTYLRVKDIVAYVESMFEVEYTISGMTDLLKQLDYVYKKPRKIPAQVDVAAQKAFLRLYKQLRKTLGKDDSVYFMDATHPQHNPIAHWGWLKRGVDKALKLNPKPKRLNINGAINIETLKPVVQFHKTINKESVKDFLHVLRKQQPKGHIHLICDNGSYYANEEVRAYADSMAIKLIYLPPYSPNLNLIERLWRFLQKNVLYNQRYETFEELEQACRRFFRNISQYEAELRTLMTENFELITG